MSNDLSWHSMNSKSMRTHAVLGVAVLVLLVLVAALMKKALNYRTAWRATAGEADRLRRKLVDYSETRSYQAANAALPTSTNKLRVVFLGDSITQRWPVEKAMKQYEAVNRGIGKQTTAEMLVRLRPDVIDLKPAAVVILGGSNDFNPEWGPLSLRATKDNISSMIELARLHNVAVVVGTIPPMCNERMPPGTPFQKTFELRDQFNQWLRSYCVPDRCQVADFALAMGEDACKRMVDAIHPNELGYAVMEKVTRDTLEHAIPGKQWRSTVAIGR